jgi:ketosteroid isomerase-like protein
MGMSQATMELVKAVQPPAADLVEVFGQGEPGAMAFDDPQLISSDLEVAFIAGHGNLDQIYHGREGFRKGWLDWLEPWGSYHMETEGFVDAGDEVIVTVRVRARTSRDGVAVEHRPAAVWTVDDGKIVRVRFFLDRADAFEAAGIDQPA